MNCHCPLLYCSIWLFDVATTSGCRGAAAIDTAVVSTVPCVSDGAQPSTSTLQS